MIKMASKSVENHDSQKLAPAAVATPLAIVALNAAATAAARQK